MYSRDSVQRKMCELGLSTRIKEQSDIITIHLVKNRSVGRISLCNNDGYWETESIPGIPAKYKGKGIGLYLYEELIRYGLDKGLEVWSSSHGCRSGEANRVWLKLKKRFRVRNIKREERYRVYGRL